MDVLFVKMYNMCLHTKIEMLPSVGATYCKNEEYYTNTPGWVIIVDVSGGCLCGI